MFHCLFCIFYILYTLEYFGLTLLRPPCLLVTRRNSTISNAPPQESVGALGLIPQAVSAFRDILNLRPKLLISFLFSNYLLYRLLYYYIYIYIL